MLMCSNKPIDIYNKHSIKLAVKLDYDHIVM